MESFTLIHACKNIHWLVGFGFYLYTVCMYVYIYNVCILYIYISYMLQNLTWNPKIAFGNLPK